MVRHIVAQAGQLLDFLPVDPQCYPSTDVLPKSNADGGPCVPCGIDRRPSVRLNFDVFNNYYVCGFHGELGKESLANLGLYVYHDVPITERIR